MRAMKVTVKREPFLMILAKKNISQNGLARVTGLTSGLLSQIATGKRNVAPKTRDQILKALDDVSFDDIFAVRFVGRR